MRLFLYNLLLSAIALPTRWWLGRHPVHAPLMERFNPALPQSSRGALWVHVCSLGEANGARPLVEALRTDFPDRYVVVTASTKSGHARCQALYGTDNVAWFPFDQRSTVRRFLGQLEPAALILFETELWPNVLDQCQRANIPVLLANGRLSDKHHRRYQRYRCWYASMLRCLDFACMQDEVFRERLLALGVPAERIEVTGSMKFDAVCTAIPPRERTRLRQEWGFREDDAILLFASTRPGDEDLASACWATLREENPRLKLVIAPRHLDRVEEALSPFSEPVIRRTALQAGEGIADARVFILDTLGELSNFFALANVVVIGGSFYHGVNGHNPLEAAALGVPTVFGPYMSNFAQAERVLMAAGGAEQVACPEDLYLALSTLLADPGKQRQMGTAARRAVLENQGAVEKTVVRVKELLGEG
jgi:3-deoxy-D-manno-octulosonic-acid transferase